MITKYTKKEIYGFLCNSNLIFGSFWAIEMILLEKRGEGIAETYMYIKWYTNIRKIFQVLPCQHTSSEVPLKLLHRYLHSQPLSIVLSQVSHHCAFCLLFTEAHSEMLVSQLYNFDAKIH
jgi:hypothetical protein